MHTNKDYIDSKDYQQPLKTTMDWYVIPGIDLLSENYQASEAYLKVLNFTL